MDQWRTYTPRQAGQVISGLQLLLESEMLGGEEQEDAKRVIRKLSYPGSREKEINMVHLTDSENDLVTFVEMTLWR